MSSANLNPRKQIGTDDAKLDSWKCGLTFNNLLILGRRNKGVFHNGIIKYNNSVIKYKCASKLLKRRGGLFTIKRRGWAP